MRRLINRRASNDLSNQPRARRQSVIRWLYLVSIVLLLVWLGDLFIGGWLYFRSEGIVLGEPATVAAEFPVTVRNVSVRDGQQVRAGNVAVNVTSQSVVENIARLTAELAVREARISELRIRGQTIDAIIEFAENRQAIASDARKEFEKLLDRGYLSLDKRTAAVESEFRSRQDLEGLKAERRVIASEIETLGRAFAQAGNALSDLRRLYDDGQMRAPIDGIVSRVAAERGAVVRAGDALVEIHGSQRFVLAYMPTGALYDVNPGDRVSIETGLRKATGVVVRVEPIAAALPREFQRAFTPVDRRQVVRVEFTPGEPPPPLFTKVKLRSADLVPQWLKVVASRAGLADL